MRQGPEMSERPRPAPENCSIIPPSSALKLSPTGQFLSWLAPLDGVQVPYDFRQVHSVEHPCGRHATLSRHFHSPVHVVEFSDRMRVRIDAHKAAKIERGLMPSPIQIEPPRVSVDFHGHAVFGTSTKNLLNVDPVAGPSQELAASHVSEDGGMWI